MKAFQAIPLLASFIGTIKADYPDYEILMRFWRDEGCPSSASSNAYEDMLLPGKDNGCLSGTNSDHWPTEENDDTLQIAYITGEAIPDGCQVAILQKANLDSGDCGTPIDVIQGGGTTVCRKTKLPIQGGQAMCCGGEGEGCKVVPAGAVSSRSVRESRNTTQARQHPQKDVTSVKRSGLLDRLAKRDCTWSAPNPPYVTRGQTQVLNNAVDCPASAEGACSEMVSTTVTAGSSNTFGVSEGITAGSDFFAEVEETTTFSYQYSYSESTSYSDSYTVGIPPGESGFVSWTPTISCVDGTFEGDCSEWKTGDGSACIPLFTDDTHKTPKGTYAFLQTQ